MRAILGDYRGFFAQQCERLARLDIDVSPYAVSHLAFRVASVEEYLTVRAKLEEMSLANVENLWNGRPISKLLLREAIRLGDIHTVRLIELIPPPHRRAHPMGLEHVGFVLRNDFDRFAERHRAVITEQQDQGPHNQPLLISFDDGTSAKFHRHSLQDVVRMEGHAFDGMHHVRDDPGSIRPSPSISSRSRSKSAIARRDRSP